MQTFVSADQKPELPGTGRIKVLESLQQDQREGILLCV